MSRWGDPTDYDEPEEPREPPCCPECEGEYGDHEPGCSLGPTWRDRLRLRWTKLYYRSFSFSIFQTHMAMRRWRNKYRKTAPRRVDDDIPF